MKSSEVMIFAVLDAILAINYCVDFDGVWTRDLVMPVRRSKQLNYEANE